MGPMNEEEFKTRTKAVGLRVIRLVESLPTSLTATILSRQLVKSGTSIGANYRAACRAISRRDMMSKLGDVEEEADETLYWLEMLVDAGIITPKKIAGLQKETGEILAMIVGSIKTLRQGLKSKIQTPKSKIG